MLHHPNGILDLTFARQLGAPALSDVGDLRNVGRLLSHKRT